MHATGEAMQATVEDVSSVEKRIRVEVPADEATSAFEDQLKRIGKVASVRGFRPGKVPRELIRKLYGLEAESEAVKGLVSKHIEAAISGNGVRPISMPDLERGPYVAGQPFVFTIVCQVMPDFDVTDVEDLALEAGRTEPSEADLESALDELRTEHAELETVEERGADTGDLVTMTYTARVMGEETAFTGEEPFAAAATLGQPFHPAGLTDHLTGVKAGETRSFELPVGGDFGPEEHAGKSALVEVKIESVQVKLLPTLDDEFAKDVGHDDLGALRASVYDKLARELTSREQERTSRAVRDALHARNEIAVPKVLIRQRAEQTSRLLYMQFRRNDGAAFPDDIFNQVFGPDSAERTVREEIILDKLADKLSITLSEEDVDEHLSELGRQNDMSVAKLRGRLEKAGQLEDTRAGLLRQKTLSALIKRAQATAPAAEAPAAEAPAAEAPAASDIPAAE
jgi:trigger factor